MNAATKLQLISNDGVQIPMTGIEELPEPLTPADADLSNFPYFPFDAMKFRDSVFAATVDPASGFYAVMLWAAAWHQVPAASLPDDDILLARLAGFGRFVDEWRKVKDGALYGFVKCSDGRLYHKHLAEHANKTWIKSRKAKLSVNIRWEKANEKQQYIECTSNEKQELYERNTSEDTNVIQREERRGEEREEINNTVDSPPCGEQCANENPNDEKEPAPENHITENFNRLWDVWPTKNSRQKAFAAFRKICGKRKPESIAKNTSVLIEDVLGKLEYINGRDSPFTKTLLASYLNGRGWEDEDMPQIFEGKKTTQQGAAK